jgi:hypothetical protein
MITNDPAECDAVIHLKPSDSADASTSTASKPPVPAVTVAPAACVIRVHTPLFCRKYSVKMAKSWAVPPEAAFASWMVTAPDVAPIQKMVAVPASCNRTRTAAVVADVAAL